MICFNRIFVFVLILSAGIIHGQPYSFRNYSLNEGLPHSRVECAFIDSRAYLWLGTSGGGLSRFDGENFLVFTNEDGLPSNDIYAIIQYDDYGLFIGTSQGLARFDGRHFYPVKDFSKRVNTLVQLQDSILLIGTNQGLYKLNNRQETAHLVVSDTIGNVLSFYSDSLITWIGTTKGLWKLSSLSSAPKFVAKMLGNGIPSIFPSDGKKLWLASSGAGIIKYDTYTQKIDTVIRDPRLHLPQCIFELEGQLWIGTQNNGILILNPAEQEFIQLSEAEGLPHTNVKAITSDATSRIWVATSGGGIAKCVKQNFRQYTKSDGLNSNNIYATYASGDNKLWFASGNGIVQCLDSNVITTFRPDSLIGYAKCKSITGDNDGRIIIGTEGRGLVIIDGNKISTFNRHQGLPDEWIQKVSADQKGNVWIATYSNGLASLNFDSAQNILITKHQLPFQKLRALVIDSSDRVWIGSSDGQLACLVDQKVVWTSTDSSDLPKMAIRSICLDEHQRLWVGTERKGIYYGYPLKGNSTFKKLSNAYSFSSENINLLAIDKERNLWVGTEKGVDKIVFEDDGKINSVIPYGKNEGFLGIETTHDAVTVDNDGAIWFGTMNGLMRYVPGDEISQHKPPKIHFEQVSLFYKPIASTAYAAFAASNGELLPGLTLSHNDNHLSFNFRAVDLNYPDQIVYRWKLIGADDDWSPPSEQSVVNYASLSPGNYTFMVQAATDDMQWSESIQTSFSIEAPYWQKKSFVVLFILGILALMITGFYFWSNQLRKREYARRHQLELQNKLLQLEQKALQLQMNPHFIFNALTSIKSLVAKEELLFAQEEINAFAQLMRSVLNNSRKQNISLAEEINVLDKYLHIEQFCNQDKFEYKITVAENLDPEEIEIPPMLLQPFVENAVIHGIAHLPKAGKIEIRFEKEEDLLICTISDNGPGREIAARLREEKKPGHQPVAVEVTKQRLEAMRNGHAQTPLSVTDILDESNSISGTRVTVRIPIKEDWS